VCIVILGLVSNPGRGSNPAVQWSARSPRPRHAGGGRSSGKKKADALG